MGIFTYSSKSARNIWFFQYLFVFLHSDMDTEDRIREIDVWIDDFTPCLKDNLTGEVVNKTYTYAYSGEEI